MTNRKDSPTQTPDEMVDPNPPKQEEQRPRHHVVEGQGEVTPGSSPCPTCMLCFSGGVGEWSGPLANSLPHAPKDHFPIAYLQAAYYDGNGKELGRQYLSIGSGKEGDPISGKTTIAGIKMVRLYWKNNAGQLHGPGTVIACNK